jgi:hypothetical protein
MRREAAALRHDADARHLTYPERCALLRRANDLEDLAKQLETSVAARVVPAVSQLWEQTPARSSEKPFRATRRQTKWFRENALRASASADAAERRGDVEDAATFRRTAAKWVLMVRGHMPVGWTVDGPASPKRSGSKAARRIPMGSRSTEKLSPQTRLSELGGQQLEFTCWCGKVRRLEADSLSRQLGEGAELRTAMERLKCTICAARPASVKVLGK